MKDLVEYVVKALVDHPEAVLVNEADRNGGTVIELKVHADDIGKVIGKMGRNSAAIRALLAVAAGKQGRRVMLDILEPDGSRRVVEHEQPAGTSET
jgi:predicted RNA-binding protein YlqC (UPF0109 family)